MIRDVTAAARSGTSAIAAVIAGIAIGYPDPHDDAVRPSGK